MAANNLNDPNSSNQAAQAEEPNFAVHNVYVMDVSFEAPNSPHVFSVEWNPKLDFDLEIGHLLLTEGVFEVVLSVTVSVKLPVPADDNQPEREETAFLVEVKQGGIFSLRGFEEAYIEHILATAAPSILFPYLRETVSSMVTKGGFPQLVLPPVNFEAMYQQRLSEAQQAAQQQQPVAAPPPPSPPPATN